MVYRLLTSLFAFSLSVPALGLPLVVLNNIDSPAVILGGSGELVAGLASVPGLSSTAMPFTTGAYTSNLLAVGATVSYVDFNGVGGGGSADSSGTNLTFSIFTDSSGVPGSSLGALTFTPPPNLPPFPGTLSEITFLPTSALVLTANTTYWVVAQASGDALYAWNLSDSGPNSFLSTSPGPSNWSQSSNRAGTRVTVDTLVLGAPELEPSQSGAPLLFVGVAMMVLTRRRRCLCGTLK